MNAFWLRHPWLRRSSAGVLATVVVVIAALLSLPTSTCRLKIGRRHLRT